MAGSTTPAPTSADIGSASNSLIAVGTDIRQQAIYLGVQLSSGDPAALQRVADQIAHEPIGGRVVAVGKDFPRLVGRDDAVAAAKEALAQRRSVATFGADGIGKSVLLRHLGRRVGEGFARGVTLIPTAGGRWQDVAQEVVRSFYASTIPVYLGPAELRRLLGPLDAVVLLDDVAPAADIAQLFAMLDQGALVIASPELLLAGDARAIRLDGLDDASAASLVQSTAEDLGQTAAVDPTVAARIARALGGVPGRIVASIADGDARHTSLSQLADELEGGTTPATPAAPVPSTPDAPVPSTQPPALTPDERSAMSTVAALGGEPIGAEHVTAVAGVAGAVVDSLLARGALRAASPQVRPGVVAGDWFALTGPEGDDIRGRLLAHYVRWAKDHRDDPGAIAEESRAILALLRWAAANDRSGDVLDLSAVAEAGLIAAGRWGAWSEATELRYRAAERLEDWPQAAAALNQMGIQALAADEPQRASRTFAEAQRRALDVGALAFAQTAGRNQRLIDTLLLPPGQGDGPGGKDPKPQPPRPRLPRVLAGAGVVAIVAVGIIAALFLTNRRAIAIEPASRAFESASVDTDGERVSFRVRNDGGATLEALDVRLSGASADAFFVIGGDCPGANLAAGTSCTIDVLYRPTHEGDADATLTVRARDGTVVAATIAGTTAALPTPSPTPSPPPSIEPSVAPSASTAPAGLADIVIEKFAPIASLARGPAVGIPTQTIPVHVEVKNVGKRAAGPFPIVITADGKRVPFAVPGEDPNGPTTHDPLAPGEVVTYEGEVVLPAGTAVGQVHLVVHADDCRGLPDSSASDCPVKDAKPGNNSYRLQSVDLVVEKLAIGEPQVPVGPFLVQPSWVDVPIAFDIRNLGPEAVSEYWVAGFLGQNYAGLSVDGLAMDDQRQTPRGVALAAGESRHFEGIAHVAPTSLDQPLTIVAGCPPGSQPCWVPEIALDNNATTEPIPLPPEPTPTPPPFIGRPDRQQEET